MLCAIALVGWIVIDSGRGRAAAFFGALAIPEMVVTAWDDNPQCDPALYYPRVAALNALAQRPGRFCGVGAFPPNLGMVYHLRDVRGYDGVDPARIVELVSLPHDPAYAQSPLFAATMWIAPKSNLPLLSALNVRYLVGCGSPPRGADLVIASDDLLGRSQ